MESKRHSFASHSSISLPTRRQSLSNKIHNLGAGPTRCCNAARNTCLVACMILLALSLWMNVKCFTRSVATGTQGYGTIEPQQYSTDDPVPQVAPSAAPGIFKVRELGDMAAWDRMEFAKMEVDGVQLKRLPTLVPIGDIYANVSGRPEMNASEVYDWTFRTFKHEMTKQSSSRTKTRPAPFKPTSVAQHEALLAQIANRAQLGIINTRTRPWCWKLPQFPWPFTLEEFCCPGDSDACENAMQLLPTDEELMEMKFASHGSCALVGPSTHLLRKELGAVIDAHEVVIRINDAPTKGYEKHVGSRTDIRVVNHFLSPMEAISLEHVADLLLSANMFTLFVEAAHNDRKKGNFTNMLDNAQILLAAGASPNSTSGARPRVLYSPPATGFAEMAARMLKKAIAHTFRSTGFVAAMYAVTSCKTVDLYGFGHDTQLQGIMSFSHYYKPDVISSLNTGHQVLSEHHILRALVEAPSSTQLRQRLSNLGVDGSLLTNLEAVNDPDEHLDRGYTICSQLGGIC